MSVAFTTATVAFTRLPATSRSLPSPSPDPCAAEAGLREVSSSSLPPALHPPKAIMPSETGWALIGQDWEQGEPTRM